MLTCAFYMCYRYAGICCATYVIFYMCMMKIMIVNMMFIMIYMYICLFYMCYTRVCLSIHVYTYNITVCMTAIQTRNRYVRCMYVYYRAIHAV
jgi:hypothetical protein